MVFFTLLTRFVHCKIKFCLTVLALLTTQPSFAFYEFSSVKALDSSNFDRIVLQSDQVWIVQFYSKRCGHCRNVAEEFRKLGACLQFRFTCENFIREYSTNNLFKGDQVNRVHLGAVDVYGNDERFIKSFHLKGVPSFMIFGLNKSAPIVYRGKRTAYDLLQFVLKRMGKISDEGEKTIVGSRTDDHDYWYAEARVEILDEHFTLNEAHLSETTMLSGSVIRNNKKMFYVVFVSLTIAFYSI